MFERPEDILKELNQALTRYGTYTYEDKGPEEMMDLVPIVDHFVDMEPEEAARYLNRFSEHKYGERLITSIFVHLQDTWSDAKYAKVSQELNPTADKAFG